MNNEKRIHIVAFNNPYPPDFGGAVDMYFKIIALSKIGVEIYLHIYFDNRKDFSNLKPYCKDIFLYKQNRSILNHLGLLPFSVKSRSCPELVENIKKIKAPIIFESLRTCFELLDHNFTEKVAVRCHNIEHDYSLGLFRSENNILYKFAHLVEAFKQRRFEKVLNNANLLFNISMYENNYFKRYNNAKSVFLPVFQGNKNVVSKKGFGKYALYHGDLSTSDNTKSALFIIDVFKDLDKPLVIASSVKAAKVISAVRKYSHISFSFIESKQQLIELIQNAHINTLYSFQRSGTKLKVFSALFNGRHCIVNKNMVDDKSILSACSVAEDKLEYQKAVIALFNKAFTINTKRILALERYNDEDNAQIIVDTMF